MSIQKLIKFMDSPNCAKYVDKDKLAIIAKDVIERFNEDLESMKDWISSVDKGLELCKPEFQAKSEPWDGAANFKSTLLTEASNQFGNRAVMELLRAPQLVKTEIVGIGSLLNGINKQSAELVEIKKQVESLSEQIQQMGDQADPAAVKQVEELQQVVADKESKIKEKRLQIKSRREKADRVSEMMNWQINNNIYDWRENQKRLMYTLPNIGSIFKKTYFDVTLDRVVSHIINYPDFVVNQATVNIKNARSFTHILAITKNQSIERIKSGLWIDCDLYAKSDSGDVGGNEQDGAKTSKDNSQRFLEQYCYLDLDEDGYEEPYIVTVHENSGCVVRIVARFDDSGVIVKIDGGRAKPILEAQRARAARIIADSKEVGIPPEIPDAEDFSGFELVRIEPMDVLTKYGFIPSYDGSFLDLGYFHLIGALTQGVNKTTNDLLNAGTLANQQTGITAKGFRKRQGSVKLRPGEFAATDVAHGSLQDSIMLMPYKEPSQTLFMLNEKMENTGRSFGVNIDASSSIQPNTAPTTTLAIVQESLIDLSAHNSRIIDSMSNEFSIIFNINKNTLDPEEYKKIVGDDEAIFRDDFDIDGLMIIPTANPDQSSRMQRVMLADAEMAQVPLVMQAGGNAIPIIKNYFERIGSDNVSEIFPNEAELSPQDKAARDQMIQSQQQTQQMAEAQLKLTDLQYDLLRRSEDRKDAQFEEDKEKQEAEIKKIIADTFATYMAGEKSKAEAQTTVVQTVSDAMTVKENLQRQDAQDEIAEDQRKIENDRHNATVAQQEIQE